MKKYPKPNENGVYLPKQCEEIAFEKSDHVKARIFVIETAPDEWRAEAEVILPLSFSGSYPSVSRTPTHKTRMDAITYAISVIENECDSSAVYHPDSPVTREAINAVTKWSRSLYQLKLF